MFYKLLFYYLPNSHPYWIQNRFYFVNVNVGPWKPGDFYYSWFKAKQLVNYLDYNCLIFIRSTVKQVSGGLVFPWIQPFALSQATEDKYVVTQNIREASIVIKNTKEPPLTLTIHLTSPLVREEIERAASGGKPLHECLSVF